MKILIVDDIKENLYLLEFIIKKMGYEPVLAENGKQALEKLHGDNFIMVISDILMPVMDGYQLCKAVRSSKKFNDVLFVFYTATYTEKEDEEFALDLGADQFLRKPFNPEKFIEMIKELIQTKDISQIKSTKTITKEEKEIFKLYSERLIQKLEKKMLDLEKAYNRAEFYKDLLSHDINNIFQSILSGIELNEQLLRRPEELDDSIESMEIVKEQIYRGVNLISNVRKLSQLEEGKTSLGKVDICKILKKSIISVKSLDRKRNKDIKVDSVGKELYCQANDLLKDVFDNILINAVKHNKNLMVEIKIKISREQKNGINYLKIEFKDNGIGIDDTRKEKIFQRGEYKNVYGIGLGLSLVKKIINRYKGQIWVENKTIEDNSKGSNFIVLIPEVNHK